jgi:hypothetical protein
LLTLGGLIFLVSEVIAGKFRGLLWPVDWLLIAALFGPIGVIAHLIWNRNPKALRALGWKSLSLAVFLAAGNTLGVILVSIYQLLIKPEGNVTLLVIPVSFLLNWFIFIVPLTATSSGVQFGKSLRQSLIPAIFSSVFAQIGIFAVLIFLSTWWGDLEPTSLLFWVMMTITGFAGTLFLFPYSFWLVRRSRNRWSHHTDQMKVTEELV